MNENLEALCAAHPEHDVAINAERLIPRHGYLVEYEHWGVNMAPQCCVAFIAFMAPLTEGRSGGRKVMWHNFTHERHGPTAPRGYREPRGEKQ